MTYSLTVPPFRRLRRTVNELATCFIWLRIENWSSFRDIRMITMCIEQSSNFSMTVLFFLILLLFKFIFSSKHRLYFILFYLFWIFCYFSLLLSYILKRYVSFILFYLFFIFLLLFLALVVYSKTMCVRYKKNLKDGNNALPHHKKIYSIQE